MERTCNTCREAKPLPSFTKKSTSRDGIQTRCNPCLAKQKAEWRAKKIADGVFYVPISEKYCGSCDQTKPVDQFHKLKQSKWGVAHRCKLCANQRYTKWREANPHCKVKMRTGHLRRKFGLTDADYESRLEQQNHSCAICGCHYSAALWNKLVVDHCHTSGKVRGLLCNDCNVGIGRLKESPENMQKAIDYLRTK